MILNNTSFFLLGIKGVAMTNIGIFLKQMGKKVTGVDVKEIFITDKSLKKNNISFSTNFTDETLVQMCEVFIYSAAHGGINHPLAQKALKAHKLVVSQADVLGEIMKLFPHSIAVSGCHGKTTTSSLLAFALQKLGKKPSFIVGVPAHQGMGGGIYSKSSYFVIEADEYAINPPQNKRSKLLSLFPSISLCLNIDYDHPDVYTSLEETKQTFLRFFSQSKQIVVCKDDPVIRSLMSDIHHDSITTYGLTKDCDYYGALVHLTDKTIFDVYYHEKLLGRVQSALIGEKNMLNTLGALVCLLKLGISFSDGVRSLTDFTGVKRRQELIWTDGNTYLYDDYAHHPAEITATIYAFRKLFPQKKLHIIFQPHTYSRTKAMLDKFAQALSIADFTYLLPIFSSAREKLGTEVTTADIGLRARSSSFFVCESLETLLLSLTTNIQIGDVIVTMGAGDVYKLKNDIISLVSHEKHITHVKKRTRSRSYSS